MNFQPPSGPPPPPLGFQPPLGPPPSQQFQYSAIGQPQPPPLPNTDAAPQYTDFPVDDFQHHPPDYFDVSKVPNSNMLFPGQMIANEKSKAKFETTASGEVKSFDKILEFNPDEVWKFFDTHLAIKPGMCVDIKGEEKDTEREREK